LKAITHLNLFKNATEHCYQIYTEGAIFPPIVFSDLSRAVNSTIEQGFLAFLLLLQNFDTLSINIKSGVTAEMKKVKSEMGRLFRGFDQSSRTQKPIYSTVNKASLMLRGSGSANRMEEEEQSEERPFVSFIRKYFKDE
jgi:hypothetical protein